MPKNKPASEIVQGDLIFLRDGKSVVPVAHVERESAFVKLEWDNNGLSAYMVYAPDEQIEVME